MPTGTTRAAAPARPPIDTHPNRTGEPAVSRFDGPPMYQQIADILRQRITTGVYPAGGTLPSGRTLAREFATTGPTISNAINVVVNEGLLDQRPGRPIRVHTQHEHQRVPLRPGDTVRARMPTPQERCAADIPKGVPILIVSGQILPADRNTLVVGRLDQGESE